MARDYAPKTLEGIASQVARDVYKKVGNTIAKEMTHQYVSAIRSFYNGYKPHYYVRKYRSYYFADPDGVKSYTKFVKLDSNGKGFTIALKVSPDNIKAPYTSIVNGKGTSSLTNLVFMNTWVKGQHGGRLPWSIIPKHKQAKRPIKNDWTRVSGEEYYWNPPVTKPSPMEMMDKWFSSYATNENLDRLTSGIVSESINRYLRRWQIRYGE